MKRVIGFLLIAAMVCGALTGCGNMSIGLGEYTFEHVHFTDEIEGHCATIDKWYDGDSGVEVNTDEYGPIFLSEGTYMMFRSGDNCPYCNTEE